MERKLEKTTETRVDKTGNIKKQTADNTQKLNILERNTH